ncbi:MAG: hypothetical protein ACP5UH_01040 [Candidatus Micrarchaeia archaeon]
MATPQKKEHSRALIYAVVIAVLIVVIAAYAYWHAGPTRVFIVNAPLNTTITSTPAIFLIRGNEYAMYISGRQSGNSTHIYIAQLPVMITPLLYVELKLYNTVKINAGSNYTTIEMRLDSISSNSISVTIIPVSASLLIAPDASNIKEIYVALGGSSAGVPAYTNSTIATTVSSTTTSVSSTTTTKPATNQTQIEIQELLNKDKFYPLVMNMSKLYTNTSACTQQQYYTAYVSYYGSAPTVTYTYQNVSPFTPYGMLVRTVGQRGLYITNFITLTKSAFYNGTSALTITTNVTSGTIANTTLGGVYNGFNYTVLQNLYKKAVIIGGPCGIEVAH